MKMHPKFIEMIQAKLQQGVIPWRKPWFEGKAYEWKSGKPYWGFNQLFLGAGEYATFRQVQLAGGRVRKGAQASMVWFYKWHSKSDEHGEEVGYPVLRNYYVFEINTQCEGLKSKKKDAEQAKEPIASCEQIVEAFQALSDAPSIQHSPVDRPFYAPREDYIHMPFTEMFRGREEYYAVLFHEMIHSTGHSKRLRRKGVINKIEFGSERYGKEELIAEIGSGMLCHYAHIQQRTIDNSASYLDGWLRAVSADPNLLLRAYHHADKAVKYILGDLYEASWNSEYHEI